MRRMLQATHRRCLITPVAPTRRRRLLLLTTLAAPARPMILLILTMVFVVARGLLLYNKEANVTSHSPPVASPAVLAHVPLATTAPAAAAVDAAVVVIEPKRRG
jgi:hypothetical protein